MQSSLSYYQNKGRDQNVGWEDLESQNSDAGTEKTRVAEEDRELEIESKVANLVERE